MVGTPFFDVYKRAVTEFKDPTLKKLLDSKTILFCETMYNFLENAIELFTNPAMARKRVRDFQSPEDYNTQYISDGASTIITLLESPPEELVPYSIVEAINKTTGIVVDGVYDPIANTFTILEPLPINEVLNIEIYYIGNWNLKLIGEEEYITSQFIVSCWSEYINNDKLDIIRLLGDTDFKLTSNSSTTTSKTKWNIVNREVATKRMSKFAWDAKSLGVYD